MALALVLVMEGILPFLNPAWYRKMMQQMHLLDDRSIRIAGLVAMLSGLGLLYLVR